ncbi:MAG: hypothetical protein ABJA98_01645 [Acidobacteriota bacterium]
MAETSSAGDRFFITLTRAEAEALVTVRLKSDHVDGLRALAKILTALEASR